MLHSAPVEPLLCRKEVCALLKRERSTVRRWEKEGLKFVNGRIGEQQLLWWLEQRDAAHSLGMKVGKFLSHPRSVREKLLAAAQEAEEAKSG